MPTGVKAKKPAHAVAKSKTGRPPDAGKLQKTAAAQASKPKKAAAKVAPGKHGRPPGKTSKPVTKPAMSKPEPARGKQAKLPKTPATPKLNVAELRARVEKLEATIATLRQKGLDAGKAARVSSARIAELENQVAGFERAKEAPATPSKTKEVKAPTRRVPRIDRNAAPPTDVPADKPVLPSTEPEATD